MFGSPRIIGLFLIVAAFLALGVWIYNRGGDDVRTSNERQNNEAGSRADESALDYDACRNAGRVWTFRTGKCGGPAPSGGN